MMMDELDILKKDWKKNENSFTQLTEKEIYGMLHKKSSSIVKWILVISILEFLLLRLLDISVFFDKKYINWMNENHIYEFEKIITIINFAVLGFFIYLFYKNFKKINTASTVKKLMNDILNTRRIVKHYVWFNLLLIAISGIMAVFSQFKYNADVSKMYDQYSVAFTLMGILLIIILIGIFWLFYKLLYGILLRRLKKNYTELEKLDL